MFGVLLIFVCACGPKPTVPTRPPVQVKHRRRPPADEQLVVRLVRSDAAPLTDVPVVVRCPDTVRRLRTDARGIFRLRVAADAGCALELDGKRHRLDGRRTGRAPWQTVRLAPAVRVSLRWTVGGKAGRSGTLQLSTRLPSPVDVLRIRYSMTPTQLLCDGNPVLTLKGSARRDLGVLPYPLLRLSAAKAKPLFKPSGQRDKGLDPVWGNLVKREAGAWQVLDPLLQVAARRYRGIGRKNVSARRWLEGYAALKALRKAVVPKARGFVKPEMRRTLSVVAVRAWREQARLLERRLGPVLVGADRYRRPRARTRASAFELLRRAATQTIGFGRLTAMVYWIAAAEIGIPATRLDRPSRAERLKLLKDAVLLRGVWLLGPSKAPNGFPVAYNDLWRALERLWQRLPLGYPLALEIVALERRPHLPVALRGAPRGDAVTRLIVRTGPRIRPLTALLGKRTALLVTPCRKVEKAWRRALARLAVHNARVGLTVGLATSDVCAAEADVRGLWQSNAELPWALGIDVAMPSLVLFDDKGVVLWRARIGEAKDLAAELAGLQAELERSWPPFAAARRVAVEKARSVRGARLRRLLALARAAERNGLLAVARRHADAAVRFDPDSSAARRRLTIVAARQHDITTALTQLRWWEKRFGALAEDVLRDDAIAASRSARHDPGRGVKP